METQFSTFERVIWWIFIKNACSMLLWIVVEIGKSGKTPVFPHHNPKNKQMQSCSSSFPFNCLWKMCFWKMCWRFSCHVRSYFGGGGRRIICWHSSDLKRSAMSKRNRVLRKFTRASLILGAKNFVKSNDYNFLADCTWVFVGR